ncbi:MAG: hypothetical protein NTV80_18535 [Verrucomicrobia bacterium]|nr:hypothetical protein [Verrucomicrobiota bacterium]
MSAALYYGQQEPKLSLRAYFGPHNWQRDVQGMLRIVMEGVNGRFAGAVLLRIDAIHD